MLIQANLLCRIDEFLKATGMSATSFGASAVGDRNFVFDLRRPRKRKNSKHKEPRSPSLNIAAKVEKFIAEYQFRGGDRK